MRTVDKTPGEYSVVNLISRLRRSFGRSFRAQVIFRSAVSMVAVAITNFAAPNTYSPRIFLTLGAFSILVLIRNASRLDGPSIPRLSATRLFLFGLLQVVYISFAIHFTPLLASLHGSDTRAAFFLVAAKPLLLLPTLVLFWNSGITRRLAPEIIAAAVVLFTFFPARFFYFVWPWYSKLLVGGAVFVCRMLVPGTYLAPGTTTMTVVGPSVDMIVDFSCSGLTGINLFQLLFGLIAIIEWNRLTKGRALVCYLLGGLAYVAANFLRLNLLFLLGNLVSPKLNLEFLGWVLFAITFYILMSFSYRWMVFPEGASTLRDPSEASA